MRERGGRGEEREAGEEEGSLASFTDYVGHHVASLTGEGEEEEERQTDRQRQRQREVLQKHEDLRHDCPQGTYPLRYVLGQTKTTMDWAIDG